MARIFLRRLLISHISLHISSKNILTQLLITLAENRHSSNCFCETRLKKELSLYLKVPRRYLCSSVAWTAMMAGEGLGWLCSRGGWTYGALWCNDCRDPLMLVLEGSYHEEQNGKIFEKVVNQVHVIGQGTIGEAAISGKHRWIIFDTICMESSEMSSAVNPNMFQGSAEWQDQILAGIKTIAVIPLPSLGVLQFGSTLK